MSNQLTTLLTTWYEKKDDFSWVLATIIETQGSSYRKAGAMLFINDLGQYFGLLSGGCLEADILRNAQQVMHSQQAKVIEYDMTEEDDISWKLGIGCGGLVRILLQPITRANHYQQLVSLFTILNNREEVSYKINLSDLSATNQIIHNTECSSINITKSNTTKTNKYELFFNYKPTPHLAIFGAGIDTRPLVAMASNLGWRISLIDHRVNNAREQYFSSAEQIIRQHPSELAEAEFLQQIDAAVVMGHNVGFDAAAIKILQHSACEYIGLLGPKHRKLKVLNEAGLTQLSQPISGPIGLNIGGELPESIALSILAEIHAVLAGKNANFLSDELQQNNTATTASSLLKQEIY